MTVDAKLIRKIEDLLQGGAEDSLLRSLDLILSHLDCALGTIHKLDPRSGLLVLVAQRGLPEGMLDHVSRIPVGKGMAGIAAERKQAVQVCNLQTDDSGVVRPGAKATRMEGSVAVPMLTEGTVLHGVLGVAKPVAYEFTREEIELLSRVADVMAKPWGQAADC